MNNSAFRDDINWLFMNEFKPVDEENNETLYEKRYGDVLFSIVDYGDGNFDGRASFGGLEISNHVEHGDGTGGVPATQMLFRKLKGRLDDIRGVLSKSAGRIRKDAKRKYDFPRYIQICPRKQFVPFHTKTHCLITTFELHKRDDSFKMFKFNTTKYNYRNNETTRFYQLTFFNYLVTIGVGYHEYDPNIQCC